MAIPQWRRRVVVTGMGVLCPGATRVEQFWEAMVQGRSYIRQIDSFDTSALRVKIAGLCREFVPGEYFSEREQAKLSRPSQFAIVATAQAKQAAGLGDGPFADGEVGVVLGTGFGGQHVIEDYLEGMFRDKPEKMNTLAIPLGMANAMSSHVAMQFRATGPNLTVSTACSSGANAIGAAYTFIRDGMAEAMLAGGAEAPVTAGVMQAWSGLRVLSRQNDEPARACKPFSKNRDGFVLTEACGVVLLEALDKALARQAPILAEVIGYACGADAFHLTAPSPEGQARAMEACLADAGLRPEDVDYINAHGTGTKPNDSMETEAIKRVFGPRAWRIPISSIKSMVGHSMGAAGALEFIASVLTLVHGLAPPTINYEEFDEECDLDYVTEGARPGAYRIVLSNSFGFGGNNAVLALKRWDG